jgi:hypothetical protein
LIGAVLSAVGAIWAQIQSDKQQQEIIRLNEQITKTVTGGDSHPLISPVFLARHGEQGDIRSLHLGHRGKYPVYDLVVLVTDVVKLRQLAARGGPYNMEEYMWRFHVGTIGRGYEEKLMEVPTPESEEMMFSFTFMARNGQFEQRSKFQKLQGHWYTATRLQRDGKVVFEHADQSAPAEMVSELSKPVL